MKETIYAIYENGLIRPLRKLTLSEGRRIRITLDESDNDQTSAENVNGDTPAVNLEGLAGCLKDSPRFNTDPLFIQKTLRDEWT